MIISSRRAGASSFIFIEAAISAGDHRHYFLSFRRASGRAAHYYFFIIFHPGKAHHYFFKLPGDYIPLSFIDLLLGGSVFLGDIFALAGPSCGDLGRGRVSPKAAPG